MLHTLPLLWRSVEKKKEKKSTDCQSLVVLSTDQPAAMEADTHTPTPSTKSPRRNTGKGQSHDPQTGSAGGTARQGESGGQGHLIGPGDQGHLTGVEGQGQQRGDVQGHTREAGDPGEELF